MKIFVINDARIVQVYVCNFIVGGRDRSLQAQKAFKFNRSTGRFVMFWNMEKGKTLRSRWRYFAALGKTTACRPKPLILLFVNTKCWICLPSLSFCRSGLIFLRSCERTHFSQQLLLKTFFCIFFVVRDIRLYVKKLKTV